MIAFVHDRRESALPRNPSIRHGEARQYLVEVLAIESVDVAAVEVSSSCPISIVVGIVFLSCPDSLNGT
jgi:hypothetical protein